MKNRKEELKRIMLEEEMVESVLACKEYVRLERLEVLKGIRELKRVVISDLEMDSLDFIPFNNKDEELEIFMNINDCFITINEGEFLVCDYPEIEMGLKYIPFNELIDLVMHDFLEKNIEELKLKGCKMATIHLIDDRKDEEVKDFLKVIKLK